jgi:hypothetical protein
MPYVNGMLVAATANPRKVVVMDSFAAVSLAGEYKPELQKCEGSSGAEIRRGRSRTLVWFPHEPRTLKTAALPDRLVPQVSRAGNEVFRAGISLEKNRRAGRDSFGRRAR